jgi:hypothetical protein
MLYTYVHHKEYNGLSQTVAHIYEHLVIHSFHAHLESLNIHPGLIGSVSGETFEHVIFLNAIFYDKKVSDTYESFLASPTLVDIASLQQMILECETEDKVALTLEDRVMFDRQLDSLMSTPWTNNSLVETHYVDETSTSEAIFQTKRTAKDFKDVALGFYADTDALDQDEQTLFLRLSVIVGDIIEVAIRKELHGVYCVGRAPISIDDAAMLSATHLRIKKNIPLTSIKKAAQDALSTIDVQSVMPLIAAHFEEFADRATWKTFVIDYYRHTGILTNNPAISSLATQERIESIFSKLKIHVRTMRKGDEVWFS